MRARPARVINSCAASVDPERDDVIRRDDARRSMLALLFQRGSAVRSLCNSRTRALNSAYRRERSTLWMLLFPVANSVARPGQM